VNGLLVGPEALFESLLSEVPPELGALPLSEPLTCSTCFSGALSDDPELSPALPLEPLTCSL